MSVREPEVQAIEISYLRDVCSMSKVDIESESIYEMFGMFSMGEGMN